MKDYLGFKGKVCVVSGARTGVGKAAAEILVDLGAKVYAAGRKQGGRLRGLRNLSLWTYAVKSQLTKRLKNSRKRLTVLSAALDYLGM